MDGKKVGETPLAPLDLPAGRHSVRLVNEESGEKKFDNIEIEPNKSFTLKHNFLVD
ncbi:PEGA domain-containing protein [Cystobacter fuscus]